MRCSFSEQVLQGKSNDYILKVWSLGWDFFDLNCLLPVKMELFQAKFLNGFCYSEFSVDV